MKNYHVIKPDVAAKVKTNFANKNGYIVKLTTNTCPQYVIGYVARCETPTENDPNLVTCYIQWLENNRFTVNDMKIVAMDRCMKIAERYEKSLENCEFKTEFKMPSFETVFPQKISDFMKNHFYEKTNRNYSEIRNYAKNIENKVNLFYKDKAKNIIWGSSVELI